ncbi:hypothetical protein GPB2148_1530 [marine gamma proteobacterium HTCC2148]|nr:hypothetical protein GPB2148_1530 [marine gamma proteobacterium HTCC2148]
MNKFNLTFWGEILPGKDPQQVKLRFAKLFGIDDPERVDHFFSGETITLRRNLDRKVAGEYFHKLHKLGVTAELVKVEPTPETPPTPAVAHKIDDDELQWETARRQAELDSLNRRTQEQKKKADEQARQRAAEEESEKARRAAKEALLKKQQAEKSERKAEETERKRVAAAETKRLREEEAVQRKAQAEKEQLRKAEEAERKRIAAAEAKRLREEEAARLKALAQKKKQRKAEEAWRKREEEAALRKAKAAKAAKEKQRKAEETATKKAAAEKVKREKSEAITRRKTEEAEEKRRLAEEQALTKAAKKVERKQQQAEAARLAAEKAELDKQKAEEVARQKTEKVAKERRRRDIAREEKAAQDALEREHLEQAKRKASEAEEKARTQQQQQRLRDQKEVEERERELEEKAIERGAKALSGAAHLKTTQAKVKSKLELPRKSTAYHSGTGKHQAGEPNLYQLKAFRNRAQVRGRPAIAREKTRKGMFVGAAALAILLLLLGRFASLTAQTIVSGPAGVAASKQGELLIIAGDYLLIHDRAGVASKSIAANKLGLKNLSAPVSYTPSGKVLLQASSKNETDNNVILWLCDLTQESCASLVTENPATTLNSLRVHDLNGDLFIADGSAGKLLKLSANGALKSAVDRPLPDKPVLRLDSGLLFINSKQGPAISVLRYEDTAFGQQLDEILLLPPPALEREHTRVWDFASNGNHWWVTLFNPDNGDSALYLFDRDWSYVRQLSRDEMNLAGQLVNWGRKILLFSQQQSGVLRYGEAGAEEAIFHSPLLEDIINDRASKRQFTALAWYSFIVLLLTIAIGGFAYAYFYSVRALVYKSRPARGADPLDDIADQIHWVKAASTRSGQLRHASIACVILALAVLVTLMGLGVSAVQLLAAMIALIGPFAGLQLILRSEPEHLGLSNEQLVLVDHRQLYHLASGPRIHYRGPFVIIDDVVIFTGTVLLPTLDRSQLDSLARPLIRAGIRVDRKTVLIKLIESHHPVARATQVAALSLLTGMILVVLEQLPW